MRMTASAATVFAITALLTLSACGNKGPLYLPQSEIEPVSSSESLPQSEVEPVSSSESLPLPIESAATTAGEIDASEELQQAAE